MNRLSSNTFARQIQHNPIVAQPRAIGDASETSLLPRLGQLSSVDQLFVEKVYNSSCGIPNNEYIIKNCRGEKIYSASEDSECCARNCSGAARSIYMKIIDNYGNEVMEVNSARSCCLRSIEVSASPGCAIGSVEQEWSWCFPGYTIKNQNREKELRINGPYCTIPCFSGRTDFDVVTINGDEIGLISKKFPGCGERIDDYEITFPIDLHDHLKGVILGGCFLIDMIYGQNYQNRSAVVGGCIVAN